MKVGTMLATAVLLALRASASSSSTGARRHDPAAWAAKATNKSGHHLFGLVSDATDPFSPEATRKFFLGHLDEFLSIYSARPHKNNMCGVRINHAFGIFMITRVWNPETIIESGVSSGVSTYLLRAAAPHARIISIDPREKPICAEAADSAPHTRWRNYANNVYLTGHHFRDFAAVDWSNSSSWGISASKEREIDPRTTMFYQDDHQSTVESRLPAIMKAGFRYAIAEDNYPLFADESIAKLQPGDHGSIKITMARKDADAAVLQQQVAKSLRSYAEIPPIILPTRTWPTELAGTPIPKLWPCVMTAAQDPREVQEPLLRPDVRPEDAATLKKIETAIGEPLLTDKPSFYDPRSTLKISDDYLAYCFIAAYEVKR